MPFLFISIPSRGLPARPEARNDHQLPGTLALQWDEMGICSLTPGGGISPPVGTATTRFCSPALQASCTAGGREPGGSSQGSLLLPASFLPPDICFKSSPHSLRRPVPSALCRPGQPPAELWDVKPPCVLSAQPGAFFRCFPPALPSSVTSRNINQNQVILIREGKTQKTKLLSVGLFM